MLKPPPSSATLRVTARRVSHPHSGPPQAQGGCSAGPASSPSRPCVHTQRPSLSYRREATSAMRELRPTYTRSSLRSGTAPRRPLAGCRQPSPRRMPLSCTGTAVTVAKRCVEKKKGCVFPFPTKQCDANGLHFFLVPFASAIMVCKSPLNQNPASLARNLRGVGFNFRTVDLNAVAGQLPSDTDARPQNITMECPRTENCKGTPWREAHVS